MFTGANVSTVEAGQSFTELTFTVANLADGADEKLTIDGTEVDLTDDTNVTTAGASLGVNVLVAAGTATVTVSDAKIAPATVNSLIDGLAYRNASYIPSTGTNRVITLTGLTDDGAPRTAG